MFHMNDTVLQSVEAVVHSPTTVQTSRLDSWSSGNLSQNVRSLSVYPFWTSSMSNL